ncbi:MAG: hypothetical protein ACK5S2_09650, partial [Lysobacteraceae bacterium]
ILTTHYLEEAENLCRNLAIIDKEVTGFLTAGCPVEQRAWGRGPQRLPPRSTGTAAAVPSR